MSDGRGSVTTPLALVVVTLAAVAAVLAGAVATGAMPGMGADAGPDGETVLDRAEQRYANAETVVGDATVTVANGTAERTVNVSYAVARPDRVRVSVADRYVAGTNGSVAWLSVGGTVLSAPVPDANRSRLAANRSNLPANRSNLPANRTAVADHWTDLNRSSVVERVHALIELNGPYSGVSADWSDRLPTNWSDRLPTNWSDRLPTNWSDRLPSDWRERARTAWANRTDESRVSAPSATGYGADRNYTVDVVGTETVDGREAYVLAVDRANATAAWNATLWVDTADYRLHRAEATAREYRVTVDFDTTLNASVRDSTFGPPDDSDLALAGRTSYDGFDAAQANTTVDLGRLGGDYAFVNATVATRSGVTLAVQQYTDGERTVALVSTAGSLPFGFGEGETVTVDDASATYVERDGRSAVVWESGSVTRAVVADLSRDELVALAEAVRT